MGNNFRDSFEKNKKNVANAFKNDILRPHERTQYPEVLDWLAGQMASEQSYRLNIMGTNQQVLTPPHFKKHATEPYLQGLASLTGNREYRSALNDDYPLGKVLIQSAGLIQRLDRFRETASTNSPDEFDPTTLDPGEVLGRLVARDLQRNTTGTDARRALDFRSDTRTPRELIEQVCAHPELADGVRDALPSDPDKTLINRLGHVELATELWSHQREALVEWLSADGNGYANMATATGKTVLGLAAVAYCTPSGALHPTDQDEVANQFNDDGQTALPKPSNGRPDDVLIVTTDDLLGVQWGRLFQEHCNTPEEFTRVIDQTIALPWGRIDIRTAGSLDTVNPADYGLAIFDEVHNYSKSSGWGEHLVRFIDADCPVLALTGSVNADIDQRFRQADREFPEVFEYDHETAKDDGIIPNFEWTLSFAGIDKERSSTAQNLRVAAREYDRRIEYDGSSVNLTEQSMTELTDAGVGTDVIDNLDGPFDTPIGLARALKQAGEKQQAPTDELDKLASSLVSRQTSWWHLRIDLDRVASIAADAIADNRPTLILTRSYEEANQIETAIRDQIEGVRVFTLDSDKDATGQDAQIQNFDDKDTDKKVLIGPGDHIGTGNDIQTVEVGINLARSGSGVSASLVQRLGRLLRNAADKQTVEFYHLLGVPPKSAIAPPDGEQFVRNTVQFFRQAIEPDGDGGISAFPQVDVAADVAEPIVALEQYGTMALGTSDADCDRFESAYVDAITSAKDGPAVDSLWWNELDGVESAGVDQTDEPPDRGTPEETSPDGSNPDDGSTTELNIGTVQTKSQSESNDMSTQTESNDDEASPDNDSERPIEGETVDIDGVLLALVDLAVGSNENDYDSRGELLTVALKQFLRPVIKGDRSDLERHISTDRHFSTETDPVLEHLLKVAVINTDDFESPDEFIEHAVLDALDIEHETSSVVVPNYDRYEFVVEQLLESDDCPHESLGEIVHAALEHQLNVPTTA